MISISKTAAEHVLGMISEEDEGKGLRIFVEGGCGGVQYGLALDQPREDDQVAEQHGLKVMVDPTSSKIVDEATVDFVDSEQGQGFQIENPNAPQGGCDCSSGCGC